MNYPNRDDVLRWMSEAGAGPSDNLPKSYHGFVDAFLAVAISARGKTLSPDDVSYPRDVFTALVIENSPYAFYLFQWVPYQTEAKRWRLKMCHDVKTFLINRENQMKILTKTTDFVLACVVVLFILAGRLIGLIQGNGE